jgi:endonuclease G
MKWLRAGTSGVIVALITLLLVSALILAAPERDPMRENGSLALGNPSAATPNLANSSNCLVVHDQYVLSYNRARGGPNWVAWHLQRSDFGAARRSNAFAPDPLLRADWQIRPNDYRGSGYERGHQCPSSDRTRTAEDNTATFYMSNMLPQTADVHEHVWKGLEDYSRDLVRRGSELYCIAGGVGTAGTIGPGKVNVPAACWKIAVVLPEGTNDLARINESTRVIAVMMPNTTGIAQNSWRQYLTTPAKIEAATGYRFFSNLMASVRTALENKLDPGRETGGRDTRAVRSKSKRGNPQPPGTAAGQVWVNLNSGVYWRPGTRYYGKTKEGKFMSEQEAIDAGYRAARGQ